METKQVGQGYKVRNFVGGGVPDYQTGKWYSWVLIQHEDDALFHSMANKTDEEMMYALTYRISPDTLKELGIVGSVYGCFYEVEGLPEDALQRLAKAGFEVE